MTHPWCMDLNYSNTVFSAHARTLDLDWARRTGTRNRMAHPPPDDSYNSIGIRLARAAVSQNIALCSQSRSDKRRFIRLPNVCRWRHYGVVPGPENPLKTNWAISSNHGRQRRIAWCPGTTTKNEPQAAVQPAIRLYRPLATSRKPLSTQDVPPVCTGWSGRPTWLVHRLDNDSQSAGRPEINRISCGVFSTLASITVDRSVVSLASCCTQSHRHSITRLNLNAILSVFATAFQSRAVHSLCILWRASNSSSLLYCPQRVASLLRQNTTQQSPFIRVVDLILVWGCQ